MTSEPITIDIASRLAATREASRVLAQTTGAERERVLLTIATRLRDHAVDIVRANADDLERGRESGTSSALLDRLTLTPERVEALARAVEDIARIADPLGETVRGSRLSNGVTIEQIRVPFGVIGAIYEARPNVTVDIAALAIKSGNAVVLRGGSAASSSNAALQRTLRAAFEDCGLPANIVQSVDDFGRQGATELMRARGLIDVLIPRGSAELIQTVVEQSRVPVIETGAGVVHVYIDASARSDWALEIVLNGKVQRPSVCNAVETVLVHEAAVDRVLPDLVSALQDAGVVVHGDQVVQELSNSVVAATELDWEREYLSLDVAIRVVSSIDEAIAHIDAFSTRHTESIITDDVSNAERFLAEVDSAVVMVNASTRFTDGGEFGFGAEVGISTQKLHARGPMGVRELTSTKWIVRGAGHTRGAR